MFDVIFSHSEDVAQGIKTFWFEPVYPVRYTAGQFIELHVPHDRADERGQKRWFTLSSSPSEGALAITTKLAGQQGSTFKQALLSLRPGRRLQIAEPMGDFVLPKDPTLPLTFVAGGIGITPVRSMIQWLHDTNQKRNIQLIHAVSQQSELAFASLFRSYPLRFTPMVGKPLTARHILQLADTRSEALTYLSGPEQLVETLYKDLITLGAPKARLVTDYFHGYSQI